MVTCFCLFTPFCLLVALYTPYILSIFNTISFYPSKIYIYIYIYYKRKEKVRQHFQVNKMDSSVQLSRWTLMWFKIISGLRINLDKIELILVGCVENVEALAAELGCKIRSLPSSYLGLPLGASFKSVVV